MPTVDQVFIIILASLLSLFFILCIAGLVVVLKLLSSARRVIDKAEDVVDSVESAAEVFKETQGRLTLFKLLRNIYKHAKRSRR